MNTKEIWKPVVGFEGYYEVSNTCKTRRLPRIIHSKCGTKRLLASKEINGYLNVKTGYVYITFCIDKKTVTKHLHTVVAEAFPEICGTKQEGYVIHHKNYLRTDNRPENLTWVPLEDNLKDKKPRPFKPKYSVLEPVYVEDISTNEKFYFLNKTQAAKFVGTYYSLLAYYLKTEKIFENRYKIGYIDKNSPEYQSTKLLNNPTDKQKKYYGI